MGFEPTNRPYGGVAANPPGHFSPPPTLPEPRPAVPGSLHNSPSTTNGSSSVFRSLLVAVIVASTLIAVVVYNLKPTTNDYIASNTEPYVAPDGSFRATGTPIAVEPDMTFENADGTAGSQSNYRYPLSQYSEMTVWTSTGTTQLDFDSKMTKLIYDITQGGATVKPKGTGWGTSSELAIAHGAMAHLFGTESQSADARAITMLIFNRPEGLVAVSLFASSIDSNAVYESYETFLDGFELL